MTRHLPPMVRRRPLGLLDVAHHGVERVLDQVRARCWVAANDPGEAEPTHTVVVNNEATRALIYGRPVNVVVNPNLEPGEAYVIDQAAASALPPPQPMWPTRPASVVDQVTT
jgi:hypothetical protein